MPPLKSQLNPREPKLIDPHSILQSCRFFSSSSFSLQKEAGEQEGFPPVRRTGSRDLSPPLPSLRRPCSICMEPMAPTAAHRGGAACAHAFCSACLSSHVRAKLECGGGAVVRCLDSSCAAALDPELCRGALPSEVFERWCAKLCESLFLGARRTYCPFPDCSEMMVADDDGEECVTQSECHGCRRLFCARCGVPWHAGVTCEEFARLGEGERAREDLLLVKVAREGNWKRCPRCRFYVEKSSGCLHITCRCGYEFCYGCGQQWQLLHDGCPGE